MLLQSLVLIATMFIVTGALLMNGLYSAKAALHQTLMIESQTEMADATARLLTWVQKNVETQGANANASRWLTPKPVQYTVCPNQAPGGSYSRSACNIVGFSNWQITGIGSMSPKNASQESKAINTAVAVNEQRLSITLALRISTLRGNNLASNSREVTLRVLNSAPYAVITSVKDLTAVAGASTRSEGDSAGEVPSRVTGLGSGPDASKPSHFVDTSIHVDVDCENSPNASQTKLSSSAKDILQFVRPGGTLAFSFEAPCDPHFRITSYPPNYSLPSHNTYSESSRLDFLWAKGDQSRAGFIR